MLHTIWCIHTISFYKVPVLSLAVVTQFHRSKSQLQSPCHIALLYHNYVGSCQSPPEQCAQTFRIEEDREEIFIIPGVVNCFSCALDSNGSVIWKITVTVNDGPAPFAATDRNFLVIEMPENYIQPGLSGRRSILCISFDNGQILEARLSSPGNNYNSSLIE